MDIVDFHDFIHKKDQTPLSVVIGVFDGVHIGHQALINEICHDTVTEAALITFRNNPVLYTRKKHFPGNLMTLEQRMRRFQSYGIKKLILIDFSLEFSKMMGEEFINATLDAAFVKRIVIGNNFHCGEGGKTSAEDVKKICSKRSVEVSIMNAVEKHGHAVSSSRIRHLILDGNFLDAFELMALHYEVVLPGMKNELSVKKADMHQVLPRKGVYRIKLYDGTDSVPSFAEIDEDQITFRQSIKKMKSFIFDFEY